YPGVVKVPQLWPLVAWIPGVVFAAEGKNSLLGPALFLVAPCAAERGVKAELVESLLERLRFHDMCVDCRTRADRADSFFEAVFVDVNDQIEVKPPCRLVAKCDHFSEFPRGIDMQQRERQARWVKRLERQVQHHAR